MLCPNGALITVGPKEKRAPGDSPQKGEQEKHSRAPVGATNAPRSIRPGLLIDSKWFSYYFKRESNSIVLNVNQGLKIITILELVMYSLKRVFKNVPIVNDLLEFLSTRIRNSSRLPFLFFSL